MMAVLVCCMHDKISAMTSLPALQGCTQPPPSKGRQQRTLPVLDQSDIQLEQLSDLQETRTPGQQVDGAACIVGAAAAAAVMLLWLSLLFLLLLLAQAGCGWQLLSRGQQQLLHSAAKGSHLPLLAFQEVRGDVKPVTVT
jgi:hypothetical protein